MPGIHKKLEQLADDVTWFACANELRVHVVYVETDTAEPVLRQVLRGSRISPWSSPYLTFVEPFAEDDRGWSQRCRTLDDARAAIAEELSARGRTIAAPAPANAVHVGDFAFRLRDFAAASAQVCAPPVVVFAPPTSEATARWSGELEPLVHSPGLAAIRWVFIVDEEASVGRLVEQLGASALVSDCRADPDDTRGMLEALLANAGAAGSSAPPHALLGMAWPRAAAPPRRASSGEPLPVHSPTPEDHTRLASRGELMRAALALSTRNGPEAVWYLRAASDRLHAAGILQEALHVRLAMAMSIATFDQPDLACRELDSVATEATRVGWPLVAAHAASAKASLLAAERDMNPALEAYAHAIQAARAAGNEGVSLLIDLLRAAGQLFIAEGHEERGIACLREALAVAQASLPSMRAGAAEVAQRLADICQRRGMREAACSFQAQAEHLERESLAPQDPEPVAVVQGNA
ncbi:hypothetical protein LVJ94_00365 [Pendulispora rubella]|uniref:MalT-like TPR region domain-containing protein n=1 Tax=Pendulispora rubella TaxID=2741070 RepID=A0ABZ2L4Q0_9BACT